MKAIVLFAAAAVAVAAPAAHAQKCPPSSLDERSYRSFGERLAIHVGDISSSQSGGWNQFVASVLVGTYRRPFLASTGVLSEQNLNQLLRQRRDVLKQDLRIPGFDPQSGRSKSFGEAVTVKVEGRPVTVRVVDVVPSRGGTDRMVVEVCGLP